MQHNEEAPPLSSEVIAEIAYGAVAAYDTALQINPGPPWSNAPSWIKKSAIEAVERLLRDSTDGPDRSHQQWMASKVADGWRYGPTKDALRRVHPMILDYAKLPEVVRLRDRLFVTAVHTLTRSC